MRQYDTSNIGSTNCDPQCIGAALSRIAILARPTGRVIASGFGLGRGHTIVGIRGSSAAVSPLALAREMFQAGSLLRCDDVDVVDAAM